MLSSYVNGGASTNPYLDYNDILKYFKLTSGNSTIYNDEYENPF